ncbi:hypothetical protein Bhyg_08231 [Pseudolycoriella hygida]|uniref:F-box domain-containing protein n=1 Tax=Pseudolycoriella hygida TaxID=35572 RepID=A0A9Q0S451_9DIPT|nr:hypothetical protein Bhyg_08231 [Pseudolycoriella hygida]
MMSADQKTRRIKFEGFPLEIKLNIFIHCDDTTLLNLSWACESFAEIAKFAFGRKYQSRLYRMIGEETKTQKKIDHRAILTRLSKSLNGLHIEGINIKNEKWLRDIVARNAQSMLHLTLIRCVVSIEEFFRLSPWLSSCEIRNICISITDGWSMLKLPNLKHLRFESNTVENEALNNFFGLNRRLESLEIDFDLVDNIYDKLHNLRHLHIIFPKSTRHKLTVISLNFLQSLHLENIAPSQVENILTAFRKGCNNIKHLKVQMPEYLYLVENMVNAANDCSDVIVQSICFFEKLTSLQIRNMPCFKSKHIIMLQTNLLSITELTLSIKLPSNIDGIPLTQEKIEHEIIFILSNSPNMKELDVVVPYHHAAPEDPYPFAYSFFARFLNAIRNNRHNIKLRVESDKNQRQVIFYKDKLLYKKPRETKFTLIHWTGYDPDRSKSKGAIFALDDKCLWRIFGQMDSNSLIAFYQTCSYFRKKCAAYVKELEFEFSSTDFDSIKTLVVLGKHFDAIKLIFDGTKDTKLIDVMNKNCRNLRRLTIINKIPNVCGKFMNAYYSLPNLEILHYVDGTQDHKIISGFSLLPKLRYLNVECSGPIYLHPNIIRKEDFYFTSLTALRITLDCWDRSVYHYGTPIQFLNGLSAKVNMQLQYLEINICNNVDYRYTNLVQEIKTQLTEAIIKFPNLLTLHIGGFTASFLDTNLLFAVCNEMTNLYMELSFIPQTERDKTFLHIQMHCKRLNKVEKHVRGTWYMIRGSYQST